MLAVCRVAGAQPSVSGQIVLVERQGAERSDLRSAVVYLEEPGKMFHPAAARPELRQAAIAMTGREFVPHIRVVLAGGTVTFPNQDPFSHNVFSNAEAGPFDLGLYRRGASRVASFPRPGIFPVYCNIHSRMVSFVIAAPSEHIAFVGADGRFTVPSVPPGTYLLTAWHERAVSPSIRQIVVPPSGVAGQRIVLDARAYVPGPHLNKFGLPYAATRVDRY
ncbi:MAG: carboxypeptidase regulatory-like domain-containing protein [Gemmatimonadaceae bacterium]